MIARLDLSGDPADLTAALVDIPSVSGAEAELAAAVEAALRDQAGNLEVTRSGNAVLARTRLGLESRIVLAGHLDTVPVNDNLPVRRAESDGAEFLHGCGTVDMKGGDAVMLNLAATASTASITPVGGRRLAHDLTFVFYDCEEVDAARNGLSRIETELPDWLAGDLAIVCEPSNGVVEAGCQGTMRAEIRTAGTRAHTARGWMGSNAIHALSGALHRLTEYQPRRAEIDGCHYQEGLQAVGVSGGVSGNVVPDEAVLVVNYRFAPDLSPQAAAEHLHQVFAGYQVTVTDSAGGAMPGLTAPAARRLVEAAGGDPVAKLGWTDVARFAARGMPAVNFGPGDPTLAHTKGEHVAVAQIHRCAEVLHTFITA